MRVLHLRHTRQTLLLHEILGGPIHDRLIDSKALPVLAILGGRLIFAANVCFTGIGVRLFGLAPYFILVHELNLL